MRQISLRFSPFDKRGSPWGACASELVADQAVETAATRRTTTLHSLLCETEPVQGPAAIKGSHTPALARPEVRRLGPTSRCVLGI